MKRILFLISIVSIFSAYFILQSQEAGRDNEASLIPEDKENEFVSPLSQIDQRLILKNFGMYITPENSPVQPERFRGYHTGVDFEVFPEELLADVMVSAICSGQVQLKTRASGYGGLVVERCFLNNEPITVIYGHLNLESITAKQGETLIVGDKLGLLGQGQSEQTDGERKHLHLGIYKGEIINIKGYVSSETELENWIDPCLYVCANRE